MANPVDIRPDHMEIVQDILREHLPAGVKVRVFGSRAKWSTRDASDLDLALEGETKLERSLLNSLADAFEDSDLPYKVDIVDLNRTSEQFRHIIESSGEQSALRYRKAGAEGEWQSLPFSEAVLVNPPVRLQRGVEYPFVDMAAVNPGIRWARAESQRKHSGGGSRFQDGDTLMARITPCLENGKIARYRAFDDMAVAHGSTEFIVIRGRPDVTDDDFAYYLTQSPAVRDYAVSQMTGTSGRQRVPTAALDHIEVALPPLLEQRRIAHILGALDDKIELNRRMNQTLDAMARAIFQDWFVDFGPVRAKLEGREPYLPAEVWELFPDRLVDSELGEIPEGWKVQALADCIDVARGLSYKGSGLSSDGMPMHNLNSIYEGGGYKDDGVKFYAEDFQERHVTQPGDVIVANTEQGHGRLLIGFAAIVPKRFGNDGLFSHHIYRVRPRHSAALSSEFVCHLLNTKAMHETVSGYATGTTVNMLPLDALRIPWMVVPPTRLVSRFSAMAETARSRQEELIGESLSLAAQRDVLLPRLVSGELRVGAQNSRKDTKQ